MRYVDEEPLFLECYLNEPIDDLIQSKQVGIINKNKILELGNFVVRESADLKNIMPIVSQYIKSLDVDWTVYTLTKPMKTYIEKVAVKLNFLQNANLNTVNGTRTDWNIRPKSYSTNLIRPRAK